MFERIFKLKENKTNIKTEVGIISWIMMVLFLVFIISRLIFLK